MSGLPTVDFVVSGQRYRTTMLGAIRGRTLYLKLLKAIAPGLAVLASLDDKEKDTEGTLLGLVARTIQDLSPELLAELCDVFAAATTLPSDDGSKLISLSQVFDLHFAGRYQDLIQWLIECVKANKFLDFLPGSAGLGSVAPAKSSP